MSENVNKLTKRSAGSRQIKVPGNHMGISE